MANNVSREAGNPTLATSDRSTSEPVLLRNDEGGVARLTLNRPEKFNALSEQLLAALQTELDLIKADDRIRVVVVEANGRAFCAGHDLAEMRASPEQEYYQWLFAQCSRVMQSISMLPQPVIASVDGMATAAGCQLVATCDLAIATTETRFAVSGINLGLFCSTPAVALSRNISRKHAFEMLFTGDFISAQQALEWGLVNRVVASDELKTTVESWCRKIAEKPAIAVKTGKQMFYKQIEKGLADAADFAAETMACNMMDDDTTEGIDAFLQKRPPTWSEN